MQNEWSKSSYLAKSKTGGRKLELDRFNKWRVLVDADNKKQKFGSSSNTVHKLLAEQ